MQLRYDDALRAVDDEGAVFRHQRNFAEENFLFLDVADGFYAGFGILIENREPDGDLQRSRVGHAALFALSHIVFELQADGIAAAVAKGDDVLVERSAAMAEHVPQVERIGLDGRSARGIAAGRPQVVQAFQVSALALPVADRVIDKFELAQAAKIGDRENALKNALETGVVALAGEQVHLQEPLIGFFLDLDQIRDRDRSFNLRKIDSLTIRNMFRGLHDPKSSVPSGRRQAVRMPPVNQNKKARQCEYTSGEVCARRTKPSGSSDELPCRSRDSKFTFASYGAFSS